MRIFIESTKFEVEAGFIPISAKLFCKNLQVAFMSYGVGLKDERPTSNIQRPTSNKKNKIDEFVKRQKINSLSFRRRPESSGFSTLWMPDQVRHDEI